MNRSDYVRALILWVAVALCVLLAVASVSVVIVAVQDSSPTANISTIAGTGMINDGAYYVKDSNSGNLYILYELSDYNQLNRGGNFTIRVSGSDKFYIIGVA